MNKKLLIFIIFLVATGVNSSQFGLQKILDESTTFINKINTVDMNNDGLKDIFISTRDNISYYINQGNGVFGTQQILTSDIFNSFSLASGDFNNDGWQDIVSFSGDFNNPNSVYIFFNSKGTFPTQEIIETTDNLYSNIKIADIDNDNDEDLIITADISFMLFYNDGSGNFTKQIVDPGVITENYELEVADIDGDGFPEIIIGGSPGTLIYKNTDGVISFDLTRSDFIQKQHFNGLVFLLEFNDFNNDGDIDLLMGGSDRDDLRWYSNDGTGLFTIAQVFETNIIQCESIISKDFDNDGDIDVLTSFAQTGEVVWYENTGNGVFGSSKIIHQGDVPFTTEVFADDLNNDGWHDVIWSRELSFHLNKGLPDSIFADGFE